jgi:L-idonate 5-dehydrogenase
MKENQMLACVIHGAHDLRVETVPEQPIGPRDAEVEIAVGGICGSDLSYFLKGAVGDFIVREPMVLGHEIVGTVARVGSDVDPKLVCQRVAVNPGKPCGVCGPCRAGRSNVCEDVFFLGSAARFPHVQGGFRERLVIGAQQLVALPDRLPFESAVFSEPLAVSNHAVHRAGDVRDQSVLVVGAGPVGALVTLVARHRGCNDVTVADLRDGALETARRVGATRTVNISGGTEELGSAQVVFEASGSPAGLATALQSVVRGGIVVQVGLLPTGPVSVPGNLIVTKDVDVRGSFRFSAAEFEEAVDMLAQGLDVAPLVTARMDIGIAGEAFKLASDRAASVKVQLTFGDR